MWFGVVVGASGAVLECDAQLAEAAEDLGLDGAFGPAERLGRLGDAQPVDVPEHDGGANGGRQRQERGGELAFRLPPIDGRGRRGPSVGSQVEARIQHRLELVRGLAIVVPSAPVAGEVDRDRRQPWPQPQARDPLARIAAHRPKGANERVLGDLLRIPPIAQQAERDRVQPVLVVGDEARKGSLDVPGEPGGERGIGVHRPFQHAGARFRCRAARSAAQRLPDPAEVTR